MLGQYFLDDRIGSSIDAKLYGNIRDFFIEHDERPQVCRLMTVPTMTSVNHATDKTPQSMRCFISVSQNSFICKYILRLLREPLPHSGRRIPQCLGNLLPDRQIALVKPFHSFKIAGKLKNIPTIETGVYRRNHKLMRKTNADIRHITHGNSSFISRHTP